ncbi:P-type conjugative transfer ATPase TrbB [Xanthomonas citri pv. citri]|uniref:P-type conjugative transfer ATPase TrbB n=1 Tax=Xanthomonas TaxID=338 RepID=UPI0003482EA5|nr:MULTISPECIES: P-type conjugative transfer ATPase TrbB [Xanthomonas]MBD1524585.1 P-type conjugative transfer ATPase TrbB [Xanthomonas citri pv. citri]KEZ98462.1 conjugal transfer protein TrbB [Xanthomonas vasicola pv. vasculorum NCPPB 895]MBV7306582.1 P-type conjugative transfer ATPase TrbB [Xanthomonas vasicola pv. vasculorum]MDO6936094.1 P-type conjugative transfer ATPase TrbB [Xanthomonas vasicola]MDO6939969.1 P-type conjugative transfer ATPase TrbB [Xanthomonas vasicola]
MQEEENHASVNARAIEKLRRDLGPVVMAALNDPKTVEVLLNPDGTLWQERLGERMCQIGTMTPQRAEAVVKTVAGYHGKTVTRLNPLVEGELPIDGSRFAGQLPPVVEAPTFAIRKKAVAIFTLDQYVEAGIMTCEQADGIKAAVRAHKNILVIGGTGSGKTTLVNAVLHEMVVCDPSVRFAILQDTSELQCAAANKVEYHTTLEITMTLLLRTILRMRPDRIVVGEVRGPEALDMLDCWNTGHEGGAATLHANDEHAALIRLKGLVTRNDAAPDEIEPLIGEAVHVIVHIARTEAGRRVQGIIEIQGYENGRYITRSL